MLLSLQPRPYLQNTRSSSYQTKSAAQGFIKLPQLPLSHITNPPSARQSITSHLQALHAQTFLAARIQKGGQTDRLLLNHKHTKDVLIKKRSVHPNGAENRADERDALAIRNRKDK